MSLTVIVVDDEALGRRGIVSRLAKMPDVTVVAECASGREAIDAVRRHRPDVLFLDVQMPGIDGFGVVDALLPDECPHVVFITAFDRHAVRAFEVNALDYVLKPIDDARFEDAVRRAADAVGRSRESDVGRRVAALVGDALGRAESRPPRYGVERLAVRTRGKVEFIRHAEIDWIEAAGDYVTVHSGQRSWLTRETMASLERQLGKKRFLRVHRSAIVNLDRVIELRSLDNGDRVVLLRGGTEVRLGRSFRSAVERLISP